MTLLITQIMAQDEESLESRLDGTVKSCQIKTRKGSGHWKALFQFEQGVRLSIHATLCELRPLIQWCLEVEAITG